MYLHLLLSFFYFKINVPHGHYILLICVVLWYYCEMYPHPQPTHTYQRPAYRDHNTWTAVAASLVNENLLRRTCVRRRHHTRVWPSLKRKKILSFHWCTWLLFTEIKVGWITQQCLSVFKKHGHFIELFFEHLQRRKLEHSLWKLYKNPLCATWGYFLLELINSNFKCKLACELWKNIKFENKRINNTI